MREGYEIKSIQESTMKFLLQLALGLMKCVQKVEQAQQEMLDEGASLTQLNLQGLVAYLKIW